MPVYRSRRSPAAAVSSRSPGGPPVCPLTDRALDLSRAVRRVRALAPFGIDAWVVLPDHMHAVWTLPEGDSDFPRRWRAIKDLFSRRIDPRESLSASRSFQGERGIWQRRYWEHAIRDGPPELRPLQPCETRLRFAPDRLAILFIPSMFRKRPLPARLARLRRRRGRSRRVPSRRTARRVLASCRPDFVIELRGAAGSMPKLKSKSVALW